MSKRHLRLGRRGAVSILFATAIIPTLGVCGLAVDYALWSQINTNLNKAVNVAALNATKIAVNGYLNADPNYITEGQVAGRQWGIAATYPMNSRLTGATLSVTVSGTTVITAVATYSGGQVQSIFGSLFHVGFYPVSAQATSIINTAPYVEVVMMIDNSSSMDIAATNADLSVLEELSPCDASNAFTGTNPSNATYSSSYWINQANQAADVYSCNNYHGVPTCPVPAPVGNLTTSNWTTTAGYTPSAAMIADGFVPDGQPAAMAPLGFTNQVPTYNKPGATNNPSNSFNQFCTNLSKIKQTDGSMVYPIAGAPCAFACHWTTQKNADGTTKDLFGLARRKGIALRFDEVKNAAIYTLSQMQADNISTINNLSTGIYTFNTAVQQIYPDPTGCTRQTFGCEAGSDFTTAQGLVGLPPTPPAVADTGILPAVGQFATVNNDDTAWPEAANSLASTYVTAAGDGNTPTAPRKVLILITDGFQDDPNTGARRAFDYDPYCTQFKNMNYQVYVVYTPYYPVMHTSYESSWTGIVEGSVNTPGTLAYNLQACSSQSSDPTGTYYISAQDQTTLNAALATFLKQALNNPARYTQ
jgi:hypothetical protein